jgi:3-oxoacyl-[acyl-carrier protein] reductase
VSAADTSDEPIDHQGSPPVALVAGGARGIGAACCQALAAEGFRVAVHDRSDPEAAEKLVASLPDAFALRADLARPDAIDALMATLAERTPHVDVLVNNAGATRDGLLNRQSLADWDAAHGTVVHVNGGLHGG